MGRFLRLIFLPLTMLCAVGLALLGYQVTPKRRKDEEEQERKPEVRMQTAGDQDEDDWWRRWRIDLKDSQGFAALVTDFEKQNFEPSVSAHEWAATRKFQN